MQPLRIRIDRIVDFGTVVSLVGIDITTAMPVTIHIDHRPFAAFWNAWWEAGLPQPVEYDADRLMLHLDMLPADDAKEVRLLNAPVQMRTRTITGLRLGRSSHERRLLH